MHVDKSRQYLVGKVDNKVTVEWTCSLDPVEEALPSHILHEDEEDVIYLLGSEVLHDVRVGQTSVYRDLVLDRTFLRFQISCRSIGLGSDLYANIFMIDGFVK